MGKVIRYQADVCLTLCVIVVTYCVYYCVGSACGTIRFTIILIFLPSMSIPPLHKLHPLRRCNPHFALPFLGSLESVKEHYPLVIAYGSCPSATVAHIRFDYRTLAYHSSLNYPYIIPQISHFVNP